MKRESVMTIFGIGIKCLGWSVLASAPVVACACVFSESLRVTAVSPWWFYGPGILLLVVGAPFWLLSAFTLKHAFTSEKLCTSGVFALCRNPIYASWIFFLVPGGLLFTRIPLLLVIPLLMYGVLRWLLHQEEQWLEETFGDAYRDYKKRVGRILPSLSGISPAESGANERPMGRPGLSPRSAHNKQ